MPHIALLGDSTLDNSAYTAGGPDVVTQLRRLLPAGWQASLVAVDGSMIADLADQLARVPKDATHLVVSVGGNDVLGNTDVMDLRVRSSAETLRILGERAAAFESAYRRAIAGVVALQRETTLCTVYNGNLAPAEAAVARVGLMAFNDVILRVAFEHTLQVIDLRLVCSEPADYANPIEPSVQGGRKIAEAIARSVGGSQHGAYSRVFAG